MTDGLTPQQVAALRKLAESGDMLLDLAARAAEKRASPSGFAASVRQTNWTPEEARLRGMRKSVQSALRAHANSEKKMNQMDQVQAEFDRTAADVLRLRAQLDALMAELGIEGD